MPPDAVASVVLLVLGIVVLGVAVWLRAGGSALARAWMSTGPNEQWMAERLVLLGLPLAAVALICAAALAAPLDLPIVRVLAVGVLLLLVPLVIWFVLGFIPLPGLLCPRGGASDPRAPRELDHRRAGTALTAGVSPRVLLRRVLL